MVLLDTSIVVTALPTIQSSFHANLSDLQWAVDAFTLSFAALMLTGGTLGDRFGRKRFFLLGLILFVIGSAFCGFASTLGWLGSCHRATRWRLADRDCELAGDLFRESACWAGGAGPEFATAG